MLMIYSGSAVFTRYLRFQMKPQLPCQYYTSCLNTFREWLSYYFNFLQKKFRTQQKENLWMSIWKFENIDFLTNQNPK